MRSGKINEQIGRPKFPEPKLQLLVRGMMPILKKSWTPPGGESSANLVWLRLFSFDEVGERKQIAWSAVGQLDGCSPFP